MAAELSLVELYNDASLDYVISNFRAMQFRPETDAAGALTLIKKYRATSSMPGSRAVSYRRCVPGHGRLFADGGLSLQSMPREVRNTIAFQVYDDVDMVNAHPNLLLHFCERNHLSCDALRRYCSERGAVLAELEPGAARPSNGKQAVLAVINGGASDPARRGVVTTDWFTTFATEMERIRHAALRIPAGAKYLAMAKGKGKRGAGGNLYGSAINLLLCDLENDVLMATLEFFKAEGRHVDVLVFDGCMVRKDSDKGTLTTADLARASDYVFNKTGIRMQFAIKDMTLDMLPVPEPVYTGFRALYREPRYARDDLAAGMHFLADISDTARSCMGRMYVRVNGAWTDAPELTSKALMELCLRANIMRITDDGDTSIMSGNVPSASRIVTAAQALMPDDPDFEERMWHSCIGSVCFRNGLWDFRRRRFFTYAERPDVFPAHVIARDFPVERPPQAVLDAVRERLLLSTLGDPELVRTYLEIIARATAGEYTDKQWAIFVGERDCGKGMLQELNSATWGLSNCNTVLANAFLMQSFAAQDAAKALSWALDCRFARQTYTNEVRVETGNRSIKLDGNAIKQFQSGGDMLLARKNHKDERQFRVATKLIMNLNDIPTITPIDAIANMLLVKFPFKFVSREVMDGGNAQPFYRLRDDSIKDFCRRPEVVDAFAWLVIDAYRDEPVVPCAQVRADTDEFREETGDDLMLVSKHFQFTGTRSDHVLLCDVKDFANDHQLSYQKVKDRLVRMRGVVSTHCAGSRGIQYIRRIATDT